MIRQIAIILLVTFWASKCFACTLHDIKDKVDYQLNLPNDQCHTISYISGRIIPIRLSYPQGQAVASGWPGEIINVRLYYVSDQYNFSALIDRNNHIRREGYFDVHRIFNEDNYVFSGSDRSRVVVRKRGYTWLAHRMQSGVLIMYQYDEKFSEFKEIDEFVRIFIERIIQHKD